MMMEIVFALLIVFHFVWLAMNLCYLLFPLNSVGKIGSYTY